MSNKFTPMGRGFRALPAAVAVLALSLPIGAGFVQAQGPTSASEERYQAAYACYKQKDYVQAEALFLRLMAEYPSDVRGAVGLAEVYQAQQRPGEAIRLMKELAEKDSSSAELRIAHGNLLVRSEDYSAALTEYQKALKLASTPQASADAYFHIGETYRRMGKLNEAIAAHRRAKDFSGKASLQLALLLDGTGQPQLAEEEYKAILTENPENAVALNNLAYRLSERDEKLDEALDYAQRARKAVPDSLDIADTVGWIYLKKRMPDPAVPIFTNALLGAEKPDNPLFRQHLAAALDLKGDWTPARRELRTLLDTAKTSEQLRRLQELLRAAQ
jgi:tetratricopeptide (TPR) repeat protein